MVQLKRPLDFQAVTDHAEYVGTVRLANDPSSELSKLPIADKLKVTALLEFRHPDGGPPPAPAFHQ